MRSEYDGMRLLFAWRRGPLRLLAFAVGAVGAACAVTPVAETPPAQPSGSARWTRVDSATAILAFDPTPAPGTTGRLSWLGWARLEDSSGRFMTLGCSGRETTSFTVSLAELARAGLGDTPWQLTAIERGVDEWRSWPVEVDAASIAAVRTLQSAASRRDPAVIDVAAGESLAEAIRRTPRGGTIRLAAGVWETKESCDLNGISLVGAGRLQTRLQAWNGQPLLCCQSSSGARIELRGITFDGMDQPCPDGLVEILAPATIVDCAFVGARPKPGLATEDASPRNGDNLGIGGSDLTFRDCYFSASDGHNVIVNLSPGGHCRFDACSFSGGKYGPWVGAARGSEGFAEVTFRNCEFYGAWVSSLGFDSTIRAHVEQCVLRDGATALWGCGDMRLVVVDTLIENSSECAGHATQGAQFELRRCTIRRAPAAIFYASCPPVLVDVRCEAVGREVAPEREMLRR